MHRRFSLKELKEIIEEDLNAGEEEYKKGRYNISSIAFFKAIVGICDYLIYRERGILPSNHTKRFDILRKYYPQLMKSWIQISRFIAQLTFLKSAGKM